MHPKSSATSTISIHAPRTGSDHAEYHEGAGRLHFNPRSPHGERRDRWQMYHNCRAFQSTLPARGATALSETGRYQAGDFNPRSPHGERLVERLHRRRCVGISIHAPRTGSDGCCERKQNKHPCISIHAPRTGSDRVLAARLRPTGNFNPRSPHGERPAMIATLSPKKTFQSTLPARGATLGISGASVTQLEFQSTLPARGATLRRRFVRYT